MNPQEIAEVIDYSSHRLRGLSGEEYEKALGEFDKVLEEVLGKQEIERRQPAKQRIREMEL